MNKRVKSSELVKEAAKLDSSKEPEKFTNLLEEAIGTEPSYIKPYVLLGNFYFKNKELEKAAQVLTKATEVDYTLNNDREAAIKVYVTLGKIYQTLGQKEKSLTSYKELIGNFPAAQVSEKLAKQIYVKLKDFTSWYGNYNRAFVAFTNKDYDKAANLFAKCTKMNPNFSWGHFFLARALSGVAEKSGLPIDKAVASFEKAISIQDHYAFRYYLYLTKLRGTKEPDLNLLESIRSECPYFLPAYIEQGKNEERKGNNSGALEIYREVMEIQPDTLTGKKAARLYQALSPETAQTQPPAPAGEADVSEPAAEPETENKPETEEKTVTAEEKAQEKPEPKLSRKEEKERKREEKRKAAQQKAQENEKKEADEAPAQPEPAPAESSNITLVSVSEDPKAPKVKKILGRSKSWSAAPETKNAAVSGENLEDKVLKMKTEEALKEAKKEGEKILLEAKKNSEDMLERTRDESSRLIDEAKKEGEKLLLEAQKRSETLLKESEEILRNARREKDNALASIKSEAEEIIKKARVEALFNAKKEEERIVAEITEKAEIEAESILEQAEQMEEKYRQDLEIRIRREIEEELADKIQEVENKIILSEEDASQEAAKILEDAKLEADLYKQSAVSDAEEEGENIKAKLLEEGEKERKRMLEEGESKAESMRRKAEANSREILAKAELDARNIKYQVTKKAKAERKEILDKVKKDARDLDRQLQDKAFNMRKDIEQKYSTMLKEIRAEKEKIKAKAIEDGDSILKQLCEKAEEHRNEIMNRAEEEAAQIIQQAIDMANDDREAIHDQSVTEGLAIVEEIRILAMEEKAKIREDLNLERQKYVENTRGKVREIMAYSRNVLSEDMEKTFHKVREESEQLLAAVKSQAETMVVQIQENIASLLEAGFVTAIGDIEKYVAGEKVSLGNHIGGSRDAFISKLVGGDIDELCNRALEEVLIVDPDDLVVRDYSRETAQKAQDVADRYLEKNPVSVPDTPLRDPEGSSFSGEFSAEEKQNAVEKAESGSEAVEIRSLESIERRQLDSPYQILEDFTRSYLDELYDDEDEEDGEEFSSPEEHEQEMQGNTAHEAAAAAAEEESFHNSFLEEVSTKDSLREEEKNGKENTAEAFEELQEKADEGPELTDGMTQWQPENSVPWQTEDALPWNAESDDAAPWNAAPEKNGGAQETQQTKSEESGKGEDGASKRNFGSFLSQFLDDDE